MNQLPFTVIAREQKEEIDIEGIHVRMVVDRIDELADGRRIVIDYKTGQAIDVTSDEPEPQHVEQFISARDGCPDMRRSYSESMAQSASNLLNA